MIDKKLGNYMKSKAHVTATTATKGDFKIDKRKSFRVIPPINAVSEIGLWFKGFDSDEQISLSELNMPDIVSVSTEGGIILEDISGNGLRFSVDKKALSLRGISRLSDYMTIYLKFCTVIGSKSELRSVLIGVQLTGAFSQGDRIMIRARILVQARPIIANSKLTFYNVERYGVKEIHVIREEITRMPKKTMIKASARRVEMEGLLLELLSDTATQAAKKST